MTEVRQSQNQAGVALQEIGAGEFFVRTGLEGEYMVVKHRTDAKVQVFHFQGKVSHDWDGCIGVIRRGGYVQLT